MVFELKTSHGSCPVHIERGTLKKAAQIIGTEHRVFIVTDSGVPGKWVSMLAGQFEGADVFTFPQGEASKNIAVWQSILEAMLKAKISRKDTLIALGGGVAGDLGGFAAATYMRGIRFVNVPSTALAQMDSGIGGKTGLDLAGVKNSVGAFRQPAAVIVDPQLLSTLPQRHMASGLAEAVKAGIVRDTELFAIFEKDDWAEHLDEIIERSLLFKKAIVEEDEFEAGSRKLLNFGHTAGHAIESLMGGELLHGECVALGMMAIIDDPQLRVRLKAVLEKLGLPTECSADPDELIKLIENDKKADHGRITIVCADEPGKAYLKEVSIEELKRRLRA